MVQDISAKPTAILFDWDNTLVDTWPIIFKGLEQTFTKMGQRPWSLDEVKEKVGGSLREHFPKVFGDKWQEAGEYYLGFYRDNNLKYLEAYDTAKPLLDVISEQNIPMGLVSNKTAETLRQEVQHLGFSGYFKAVIGAGDAAKDKPSPDSILHALDKMGLKPDKSIFYVGDSSVDVLAAESAGLTSVLFEKGYVEDDIIQKADHIFKCLTDLTTKFSSIDA